MHSSTVLNYFIARLGTGNYSPPLPSIPSIDVFIFRNKSWKTILYWRTVVLQNGCVNEKYEYIYFGSYYNLNWAFCIIPDRFNLFDFHTLVNGMGHEGKGGNVCLYAFFTDQRHGTSVNPDRHLHLLQISHVVRWRAYSALRTERIQLQIELHTSPRV